MMVADRVEEVSINSTITPLNPTTTFYDHEDEPPQNSDQKLFLFTGVLCTTRTSVRQVDGGCTEEYNHKGGMYEEGREEIERAVASWPRRSKERAKIVEGRDYVTLHDASQADRAR
jgi:hypothetical protein